MRSHSIDDVADILGIHPETALSLIRTNQLAAVNVSESENSRRRRYRVTDQQLSAFIERRSTIKSPATTKPATGKVRALAALRDCRQHYRD